MLTQKTENSLANKSHPNVQAKSLDSQTFILQQFHYSSWSKYLHLRLKPRSLEFLTSWKYFWIAYVHKLKI